MEVLIRVRYLQRDFLLHLEVNYLHIFVLTASPTAVMSEKISTTGPLVCGGAPEFRVDCTVVRIENAV